jgi:hypothetical protein
MEASISLLAVSPFKLPENSWCQFHNPFERNYVVIKGLNLKASWSYLASDLTRPLPYVIMEPVSTHNSLILRAMAISSSGIDVKIRLSTLIEL